MFGTLKNKTIIHFCFDTLLVIGSFLFIIWLLPATRKFYLPAYDMPFVGFMGIWLFSSLLFGKYKAISEMSIRKTTDILFRSKLLVLATIASLIFLFKRFTYSQEVVFGTILLASILEFSYTYIIYIRRKQKKDSDAAIEGRRISTLIDYTKKEQLTIPTPTTIPFEQRVDNLLKTRYFRNIKGLFEWVNHTIKLDTIKKDNALVLYSHHIYNIEFYDPNTLELLVNLYKVNDLRHVNKYFLQVWENLVPGGYYLLCARTNQVVKSSMKSKYPIGIGQIAYFFYFLFHRLMPKIPVLSQIYFSITKGKQRAFSFTEILGRLYYCGFSAVETKIFDGNQYFMVRKTGKPVEGQQPSYGPLIRLKRIGKDGKPIKVLKMRTMHPYSEFLQDYIYQKNHLQEGGKFKNDFRITTAGKVMRKLWIDELPMLINLLRGELKLVGVRPISKHYLDLYSPELQKLRMSVKPGLVPPYYADLPKTLEEIEASELRYLNRYKKNRIFTDIRYFFKAITNIIFRNARSA